MRPGFPLALNALSDSREAGWIVSFTVILKICRRENV